LIIPAALNIEIEEVLGQRSKEDYNAGAPQAPVGEVIGNGQLPLDVYSFTLKVARCYSFIHLSYITA